MACGYRFRLHFKTTWFAKKYGLKSKVTLNRRDIYMENIRLVSPMAGVNLEAMVK